MNDDPGMAGGLELIDDAEVLLRRILAAFRPDPAGPPQLDAFLPHRSNGPDGLSPTRQKYALPDAVGRSAPAGKGRSAVWHGKQRFEGVRDPAADRDDASDYLCRSAGRAA